MKQRQIDETGNTVAKHHCGVSQYHTYFLSFFGTDEMNLTRPSVTHDTAQISTRHRLL